MPWAAGNTGTLTTVLVRQRIRRPFATLVRHAPFTLNPLTSDACACFFVSPPRTAATYTVRDLVHAIQALPSTCPCRFDVPERLYPAADRRRMRQLSSSHPRQTPDLAWSEAFFHFWS
jgi:hypothetical protein